MAERGFEMKNILLYGENISKAFTTTGQQTNVLDMVNMVVREGDFTVIMGASGSGKSTLLYALSGMDSITGGKVFYKEKEISGFNENQMAELRSHEFGFVFQQTHLVSNLTLLENVAVAGCLNKTHSAKDVKEKAQKLLLQMGVDMAKDRLPSQVSGGEAQRAAVARAIINEPGLIFADEPTGALNKHNTEEVLNLFTGLHEFGQSILMVTHDLRAAIRGTRIIYLEDGKILDELILPKYKPADIKDREEKISEWLSTLQW